MHLARTILALLITLSVAMLPVAGSAAFIARSGAAPDEIAAQSHPMSEMAEAMDCCPDQASLHDMQPCDQAKVKGHCDSMACCAAQSVSLANAIVFRLNLPTLLGSALPVPVDQVVSLHSGSPLFRPPRV